MELPQHYFPARPCPHSDSERKKELYRKFSNSGSHGNLNVRENKNKLLEFQPQYGQRGILSLGGVQPSTPVFNAPLQQGLWLQEDRILGVKSYFHMMQDMRLLHNLTVAQKLCLNKKKSNTGRTFTRLKKMLEHLGDLTTTASSDEYAKVQLHLQTVGNISGLKESISILTRLKKSFNEECLFGYNTDFYGGLLCHVPVESSKCFLIHARGLDFSDIYMTKVSFSKKQKDLAVPKVVAKIAQEKKVFQLVSNHDLGPAESLICARLTHGCNVFTVDTDTQSLKPCASLPPVPEVISSVSFSPYLFNELVVSSKDGAVYLWDINASRLNQLILPRSNYPLQWSCSYIAGHPRQLAVADKETFQLFDHRSNFTSPKPVFSPSQCPHLMVHERILSASLIKYPHHVVLTDHSVLVLDQRFPGTPVLQWSHEFPLSAPQYTEVHHQMSPEADVGRDNTLLFVASQQPPEIHCFPFNIASGQALTAASLPFRTGRPKDVFLDKAFSCSKATIEKRFEASLAGLSVVPSSNGQGFTLYQMDSYGDLFYQPFRLDSSSPNLDFLSMLSDEDVEPRCNSWIDAFKGSVVSENPLSREEDTAVSLSQCLWSKLFKQDLDYDRYDSEAEGIKTRFDYSQVPVPKQLTFTEHLPCKGLNTQLLLAQRHGKMFGALLESREKEHKKLRKKLRQLSTHRNKSGKYKSKPFMLNDNSSSDSDSSEPGSCREQNPTKINSPDLEEQSDSSSDLTDVIVSDLDSSSSGDFGSTPSQKVSWKKTKRKRVFHTYSLHKHGCTVKAKRKRHFGSKTPSSGPSSIQSSSPQRYSARVRNEVVSSAEKGNINIDDDSDLLNNT